MSGLDAGEVLSYLNQLGYQNISPKQLKEFMKDLKKLIKYESKYKQVEVENIQPPTTSCQCNRLAPSHYLAPTESSKAKEVSRKEQIVSVQIKRPAHTCQCTHNSSTNKQSFPSNTPHDSQIDCSQPEVTDISNIEETATSLSPKRPKSCEPECQKPKSTVKFRANVFRPKTSYIVPRPPVRTYKSDPVALYHKYQQEWKRQKLPGEDNHSDLRWAIRERMLGQPRVMSAAPSMEAIARKRKITNRI